MNRALRRPRAIGWIMAFGILVLVAELLMAWKASVARKVVLAEIHEAAAQWRLLAGAEIAPTTSNLEAIQSDRSSREAHLEELVQAMIGPASHPPSAEALNPEALYFELVEMIERMRLAAKSAGVVTKPGETFGFQRFIDAHQILLPADAGPAVSSRTMECVDFQRRVAEALLNVLFGAAPHQLVSLEREPVGGIRDVGGSFPSGLFRREPWLLRPMPEGVESCAFRLVFMGRTAVLRAFLEGVAGLEHPVAVSAVTVAPEAGSQQPSLTLLGGALPGNDQKPGPDAHGAVQIIDSTESQFTVIVEWYRSAAPGGEVAER